MLFGGQENSSGAHKCGFSPKYLAELFQKLGFMCIVVRCHPQCSTDMILTANRMEDRSVWILRQIRKGESIINIGCNTGQVFLHSGFEDQVTSVDMDVYDLPRFHKLDAHKLISEEESGFRDKQFDTAVLGEIVEHSKTPDVLIKGALRVARRVLITTPNPKDWAAVLRPYETVEENMKRTGKDLVTEGKESNPTCKEFDVSDGGMHLYHVRWDTPESFQQLLDKSMPSDYESKVEVLSYDGWSFFCAELVPKGTLSKTEASGILILSKTEAPIHVHTAKSKDAKLKIGLLSTPIFTVPPQNYGGLEQIVYDLAEELALMGHEVTVFAPDGSAVPGCSIVSIGAPFDRVEHDWVATERDAHRKIEAQLTQFDIIHGHNWLGFEYLSKAKHPELKVCHTHHGGLNPEWWLKQKPPFHLNFIAISDWMQKVYQQQGMVSQRVYNGVDLNKYPLKSQKSNRLLFVGRFDVFKQPHVALAVAEKLNLPIDLVGGSFVQDPNYLQQIKNRCDGDRVKIYVDADNATKVELMQNAKAVLVPSRMGEPFGLVPIEAMACGTPAIVLADGAMPETVKEGGVVCADAEAMADAVAYAVDHLHISAKMCRHNAEKFSRRIMAMNYVEKYRAIIDGTEW